MRSDTNDAELRRLARVKSSAPARTPALGPELLSFFKQNVQKRQTKFAPIAACWDDLIPETLRDHTALESFTRGTLMVVVDSSSHLYELKQLLLCGLEKQLVQSCKSAGLRKVVLKPGRWYDGRSDSPADQRLRF